MGELVDRINWAGKIAMNQLKPGEVAFLGTYRCWVCNRIANVVVVVSPCPQWAAHPPDEACETEGCEGPMTMDLRFDYIRIVHPDSPPLEPIDESND